MAAYIEEEEVWKCTKHPSKRRKTGICPICLRDRLATLCPHCANVRPCSCCAPSSSSSSSSSSSFSRFSVSADGSVSRVHNLTESDSSLRRSRSLAIPFLRSRSRFHAGGREMDPDSEVTKDSPGLTKSRSTRWFWSMFKPPKSNRSGVQEQDSNSMMVEEQAGDVSRKTMMMRSMSVAVSGSGVGELREAKKGRGWYFPSPMKAFRQSNKALKVVQ